MVSIKVVPGVEVMTWRAAKSILSDTFSGSWLRYDIQRGHRLQNPTYAGYFDPSRKSASSADQLLVLVPLKSGVRAAFDLKSKLRPTKPVRLHADMNANRAWWMLKDKVYVADDLELSPADVLALVNESENKRRLQLQKAHALQDMTKAIDDSKLRKPIPREAKLEVWQRDGGRCVECGSQKDLEFDHVIPLALGGSNTARNLQLLCAPCNHRKGASLG